MQRIAVLMIGGVVSSTVLTLVVMPAVYGLVKGWLPLRSLAAKEGALEREPAGLPMRRPR